MRNTLFKNLSILLIFGIFVKILGLYNKIILTRTLGLKGLAMYTKMLPIAGLFLTIASFSLAPVVTQLVSINITRKPYSNRDLIYKSLKIAFITSSIVSIVHLIFNYVICHYLLKNDILIKPFLFFIPFYYLASVTGIFKGYFHGHNKMDVYALGQLIEQLIRIIACYLLIIPAIKKNVINGVVMAILTLSISEIAQNIYLFIRLLFFTKIKGKRSIKAEPKTIINKSINLTTGKLIGAIAGFLEPIIFTYAFLQTGLSQDIADNLYGIIYGYSIPIILTTTFITSSIESATLPSLISSYENNNQKEFNRTIDKALYLSYIPAIAVSYLYFYFSYEIMQFFYHTTYGAYYIKVMAIPSFIAYFEGVFVSSLLAIKKERFILINTILNNTLYLLLTYLLVSIPKINGLGLVISFSITMITSTLILAVFMIKSRTYRFNYKRILLGALYFALMMTSGYIVKSFLAKAIIFFLFPIIALIPLAKNSFYHRKKDNEPSLS